MKILRDFTALPATAKGPVLALGNFDGLHLGHQAVLEQAAQLAKELKAPLGIMTFEPHPRRLFKPDLPPLRIVSLAERLRLLRENKVELVYLQRFTRSFSQHSATEFVQRLLCEKIEIQGLVTGEDFIFGHQRGGNTALLREMSMGHRFLYQAVNAYRVDGVVCSSSRIREALTKGDVKEASKLLGRPYAITGRVITGEQRGRQWGFPTANLKPGKLFLPCYGIYAARLQEGDKIYPAVANFGVRPMYPLEKPLLETHVLDASPDLYDKKVKVELVQYLRPEAKLADETALRRQIEQDCEAARQLLLA